MTGGVAGKSMGIWPSGKTTTEPVRSAVPSAEAWESTALLADCYTTTSLMDFATNGNFGDSNGSLVCLSELILADPLVELEAR